MQFPHDNDTCYMAHCYPYTYTDLMLHLGRLEADAEMRKICRRRLLCRTIANNRFYFSVCLIIFNRAWSVLGTR